MEREHASEQARLWNGTAGQAWVDVQAVLDQMFKPFEDRLASAVVAGSRVLDIGCGTGATTLACARKGAESTGLDISEPMLALAQQRAQHETLAVRFICADAQHHTFAPGNFDRIVSRFGVMFFDDPVCAFANLRRAARADAALHCFAWRGMEENAFMTVAERAAKPLLPDMPLRKPDSPGQFAFSDAGRVAEILEQAGWHDIKIRPVDVPCIFPAAFLEMYFTRLGPLGLVLQQIAESERNLLITRVRQAFAPYVRDGDVHFIAACWSIEARA